MKKLESILIKRVEGRIEDIMEVGVKSWVAAEKTIMLMAQSAPPTGEGYDKADFTIVWEDGQTYRGRIDLQEEYTTGYDLKQHIKGAIEYFARNGVADPVEAEKFLIEYINE